MGLPIIFGGDTRTLVASPIQNAFKFLKIQFYSSSLRQQNHHGLIHITQMCAKFQCAHEQICGCFYRSLTKLKLAANGTFKQHSHFYFDCMKKELRFLFSLKLASNTCGFHEAIDIIG
jgi:hypothetical protein